MASREGGSPMWGSGMMYGHDMGASPWWGVVSILVTLAIIGVMILLIVWLVRQFQPDRTLPGARGDQPLTILKERYARGELTKEQFEQMRHDIA
jgi:putative membrane protein